MSDSLNEWCINFVKHKDIFNKKLIDHKIKKDKIEFNYKDKKQVYVIMPILNQGINNYLKNKFNNLNIVCLNKKENLNFLKLKWREFVKYENLKIFFVNPKINNKWVIKPNIHDKISDKENFSQGLKSMFENVEEVS